MADATDWSGFDTDAHRAAQAGCTHLIHCAVDAANRNGVSDNLAYARHIGDPATFPLLIAHLTGPCCLLPADPPQPVQRSNWRRRQPVNQTATTATTEADNETDS